MGVDPALAAPAVPPKAQHGGVVQAASAGPTGTRYYELLLREFDPSTHTQEITLYAMDARGGPVQTSPVVARAVVLANGKASVDLLPVGDNVLMGNGIFQLAPATQIIVTLSWAKEQFPETVKFTNVQRTSSIPAPFVVK